MIYHLICFADLILDEPTRDLVGFSMIAVSSFNLVSNLSYIMFGEMKKTMNQKKETAESNAVKKALEDSMKETE